MEVTVSIEGLSLVESGTALLANPELKIMLGDLPVTILFKSDSGAARWATEGQVDIGVVFTLFNMTSSNGEGVLSPISIAKSTEVEFFITFFVTSLNKGSQRIFVYNFLEKRIAS
jgi:hypothetical protein